MPPVVPGAVGFGMATRAAYGAGTDPTIYRVTSLADTNTVGTFRYACLQSGPRVVVFETSGYIDLASDIIITNPYLTVAGQTAPSPGITVRMVTGSSEAVIQVNTHDLLFQHFRIRPGWNTQLSNSTCNSAFQAYGYLSRLHYNIVLDHMSISWGQDEGISVSSTDINSGNCNFTVWKSIMAEGLWNPPGSLACGGALNNEPANGHGLFIEGQSVDVIQSLFVHNRERNPMCAGSTSTRMLNNILYGWQGEWGCFVFNNNNTTPGPWYLNATGNRYIVGPQSNNTNVGGAVQFWWGSVYPEGSSEPAGNQAYLSDNTVSNSFGTTIYATNQGHGFAQLTYNPAVGSPPSQVALPAGYTPLASTVLEATVLPDVGARPIDRDAVDTRLVANVTNRSGGFITTPADAGGYPTLAVNTRGLSTPANPHTLLGSGYTNLEVWLHGYASALEESVPRPPGIDPAVGRVIVNAPFTGSAGTAITSYTSTTGGGWNLQAGAPGALVITDANRLRLNSTGAVAIAVAAGIPISTEYDVEVDFRVFTLISGNSYGVWGRTNTTTQDGYLVSYTVDSGAWELDSVVGGTFALVGNTFIQALTPGSTYHVSLRVRTGMQQVFIDNIQQIDGLDTSVTATGKGALSAIASTTADTNSTGIHFDNFLVTDVRGVPYVWPRSGGM